MEIRLLESLSVCQFFFTMETDLGVGATLASADLIIETDTCREETCVLSAFISRQSVIVFFHSVSE